MKKTVIFTTLVLVTMITFQILKSQIIMQQPTKKVNVWDTYVTKKDGTIMHFDILAPVEIKDTNIIYNYGKEYLKTKNQEGQPLTSKQCRLCHVESVKSAWQKDIDEKGYFIIEMEGCH